ncbi:GRIP1-associated protein 1-like [Cylas formicarius]|uniref:GRIP1-associated protein 1-like n=1 Tax=Cylas formicarius TaxID=197179 RepID=UPI002958392E|nr:GRIP1-associated protein 1-like [Cylas formicarius]
MTNLEKPPLTADEKYQLALQTEQELARCSRTYTILERNRNEFLQAGAGGKLAKHKKVLNIFKKEQRNILTDFAVASSDSRVKEDEKRSTKLSFLLKEYDDFDNTIKNHHREVQEIDYQIQMVKKETLELAKRQIGDDRYQERVLKADQTVQTLENKLEVQIKKFCAICAENNLLRYELRHLLNERTEFNKTWDNLISNLVIGKKFMMDLIEQATIAYDQREEWVSKLQILRTRARNDLLAQVQEMRVLQRKRDNDVKLQDFFATKGQKRLMVDLEAAYLKKRERQKRDVQNQLAEYLNSMNKIKEFTELEKVQEIVKTFLRQEEENFSMFKYVTFLNKEMEELSDNLSKLHSEIETHKEMRTEWEEQQENSLKELNEKVEQVTKQADAKQDELQSLEQKLNVMLKGVETLFQLFGCNNDPLIQMLGRNETIHYYNVLLYLQILENNIQEAFVDVFYKEQNIVPSKHQLTIIKRDRKPEEMYSVDSICATNPCPLCLEHELVSDVIDLVQVAYTKEQIKEKLKQRLTIEGSETALHNVSACHLPKSRQIIQKRYQ